MTARRDSGALPGHHELDAVCGVLRLDLAGAQMLPSRSNAVFHLPAEAGRDTDPTPLLGWVGWDHAEQALALGRIVTEREAEGWADERLVPLVAGLAELQAVGGPVARRAAPRLRDQPRSLL